MTHGNTRILSTIMPNPKGHEDSIKDSRFKAAWQSGPTRTIRVPIALVDATLEYARQLDRGIEPRDTSRLQAELEDARSEVQELRSHLEADKKRGEEDEGVFWYLHGLWESSQNEVKRLR